MRVSLDIFRLRHFRGRIAANTPGPAWKGLKGAIDEIGGALVHSGLVHALLLARSDTTTQEHSRPILESLVAWFENENCPVNTLVGDALSHIPQNEKAAAGNDRVRLVIVALIGLDQASQAMAIQAEAIRYLGQAKLMAKAFAGGGG